MLIPSMMLTTRGGWQQGNANGFVLAAFTFLFIPNKNYVSTIWFMFFSVMAFITHAESIYSLTAISLILIIYEKLKIKHAILINLPVLTLAIASILIKSPVGEADIRPDIFLNSPMFAIGDFWPGVRENFPILLIWTAMLIKNLIIKDKRLITAIALSTLPWLAQLFLHSAKHESKHYLAVIPIIIIIMCLEKNTKKFKFYLPTLLAILLLSAGVGIFASYYPNANIFYGWNAQGKNLFHQNILKRTIKDFHVKELLILDNKTTEMYSALTYAYQLRRPFRFVDSLTDIRPNEFLITGHQIEIEKANLQLIVSNTQIKIWKRLK